MKQALAANWKHAVAHQWKNFKKQIFQKMNAKWNIEVSSLIDLCSNFMALDQTKLQHHFKVNLLFFQKKMHILLQHDKRRFQVPERLFKIYFFKALYQCEACRGVSEKVGFLIGVCFCNNWVFCFPPKFDQPT